MKLYPLLFLGLLLADCQSQSDRPTPPTTSPARSPTAAAQETAAAARPALSLAKLALTANALQVVNAETGATRELPVGQPFEALVRTLTSVLGQAPASVGVNGECGAGPLKMATWSNGLTVAFQEKARRAAAGREWQFVGWSLNPGRGAGPAPATMAGVGLGSTRAEMESAYVIKVAKTSLGSEFSTTAGLYGIFDGAGPQARVTALWSGTSCVFR